MTITLILVIITALVSIGGFTNQKLINDLIFYPPFVQKGQVYRFISHGFIHADAFHLIFNMIALYSFGDAIETTYQYLFGATLGKILYVVLYLSGLIVASLPDYFKHKENYHYRSLGASGAVSAVLFSCILFYPKMGIGLIILPGVPIPGYIFGIIYLIISSYLAKRGQDNIGHTAHITGAIYGLLFSFVVAQLIAHYNVIDNFIYQIKNS